MISDILIDAIKDIEEYLREENSTYNEDRYKFVGEIIKLLVLNMKVVFRILMNPTYFETIENKEMPDLLDIKLLYEK